MADSIRVLEGLEELAHRGITGRVRGRAEKPGNLRKSQEEQGMICTLGSPTTDLFLF